MSSAKQSLFKELDLDEPQWDVFSMTYDALKARLAEATAFGVECQRALEISRDRLAKVTTERDVLMGIIDKGIVNAPCPTPAQWREVQTVARQLVATRAADSAPAVTPFCGPFPEQSEDERTLRYMLALRCGELGELYGDDGELQLGGFPYPIDFRRDSVAEIRRKLDARGMAKLAKQLKAADSAPAVHQCAHVLPAVERPKLHFEDSASVNHCGQNGEDLSGMADSAPAEPMLKQIEDVVRGLGAAFSAGKVQE